MTDLVSANFAVSGDERVFTIPPQPVAYLENTRGGNLALAICARPCNGQEYADALRVNATDKKSARAYCVANGIKPWNF